MSYKHIFDNAVDKLYPTEEQKLYAQHRLPEVDAFDFITSPHFLSLDPRPWQSIAIKTFYNLWGKYAPTPEEEELLRVLEYEWRLKIDIENPRHISELILVDGRRSGKSALMSFFAAYEVYSLLSKYNPQKYYNMLERTAIHVMHVSVSGDQAADMFQFTKDRLRSCSFFTPYFDWTKYNESEMRIFTPYDLDLNKRIGYENDGRQRGTIKQADQEGSIIVESITTKAASKRGRAIKFLIFSEYAHFDRPQMETLFTDDVLGDEAQQTDYAMWKALTPSVKDFGIDGRVLYESSPRERGGQFYFLYCEAGGMEQEKPDEAVRPAHMQVIQLSTWQCNPAISRESLVSEFRKDPVGANAEFGSHFGNASGNFLDEAVIAALPQPGVSMLLRGTEPDYRYVISVDPGGQAKKKVSDTYVVSWGHYKMGEDDFWVDGFEAWNERAIPNGTGGYQKITVDPVIVTDYILDLADRLGRNFVLEIVYDQWNSAESISRIQRAGFPALETFFSNQYKADMYGNFLALAQYNRIKSYGGDINGHIIAWQKELRYLQRYVSGGRVYFAHPSSGPVMHDDYADCAANLVFRLSQLNNPTRKSMKDRVKKNLAPTTRPKQISPMRGGNLSYRGGSFGGPGGVGRGGAGSLADRIGGGRGK